MASEMEETPAVSSEGRSAMVEALVALAQEKNIDELYLLDRLEQSLAKSYADILKLDWGAKVTIDRNTGKIYVYKLEPKGDINDETGEFDEWECIDVTPKDTNRLAAQHAKIEINQIIRNAAREQIYAEFSKCIGDMIVGTVLQTTAEFTILKIRDGVEAELPHFDKRRHPDELNERPAGEFYQHGQRIRAVIIGVRDPRASQNGNVSRNEHNRPAIIVSRTHPDLIRRLFENEVPEIYEGIVEIKAIAREPGMRSKMAVNSLDAHLDPVGACVGPKGTRVRNVVNELRGERIDVVLWDKDPAQFVANALSPARVTKVVADLENKYATVIVPDDQLSLAIGKEGQNARLAARLTGWHIDIKNESLAINLMGGISLFDDEEEEEPDNRCAYTDLNGIRCRNAARPGSIYCSIHEDYDDDSLI